MKQYRQGDVLLIETNRTVHGKKRESGIILEGEVTGHAHKIIDGLVFEDNEGNIYVSATEKTQLIHEEHAPINIEKGEYEIRRQRELGGQVED